jgi:arginine/lysine/ornithine decarboxylase
VWLEPEYDPELEIAHGITPETLTRPLAAHPDCRAVFITTRSSLPSRWSWARTL